MTESEKDARIQTLESTLKKLWGTHIAHYLSDPKDGRKFIELDRIVRELGLMK